MHFLETYFRESEGRFVANSRLLLKNNINELGDFYQAALKYLKSIEKRLKRQPKLRQAYHNLMSKYLQLGHMKEVLPGDIQSKPSYYISYHAVLKEDSNTIKLRVVFDASCKTRIGVSLNDCINVGLTIQGDLFDIILRLRQHQFAMSADIAKMY